MVRRLWGAFAIVIAIVGPIAADEPGAPRANDPSPKKRATDEIFGLTKVHQFHLLISAKDYAAMEPDMGGFPFGPGGPGSGNPARPGPGQGRPGGPPAAPGFNGFEFEYVHGDFQVEGETIKDVGVRYKGNATYMASSGAAKRSFKIDFDRYDDNQKFHGTRKLNLNNEVMDPTRVHEALAYAVFRAADVPASRTAFAEVRLTVPGKYDAEYLGVYTLIEQVDKAFLKTHFKNAKGLLLKPEGVGGMAYLGDDPAVYEKPYNAKSGGSKDEWQRFIEFTKLIHRGDDNQFRTEIGNYLDIDQFVRLLAVNVMLSSLDGALGGMGHNYYLYLSPESNRFVFIPWDLDITFGGFPMFFSPEQQMDLSIEHPHQGDNKLIDRLLTMPEVKQAYRERLRQLAEEVFSGDQLANQIAAVEAVMKDPIAREKKAADDRREGGVPGFGPLGPGGPPTSARTFVETRAESVMTQLAGKSKGFVPTMPFGPPGMGGPGGGPGRVFAKPALQFADQNKDGKLSPEELQSAAGVLFKRWDKDGNGTLDEKEIEGGINSLVPGPQSGPPGGGERGRPDRRRP
ncbi:MAG: hypothetical protein EXS05_05440 [Planctomycetaceae bacterium]|nr:hypothetical protein [Planctomycetaceae bacterium]